MLPEPGRVHRAPRMGTHDQGEGSPGAAASRKDEDESRGHSWAKPSPNTKSGAGLKMDTATLSQQLAGTDIRDAVTANRVAAPRGLQQTQWTTQHPPLAGAHPRAPELSAPEASECSPSRQPRCGWRPPAAGHCRPLHGIRKGDTLSAATPRAMSQVQTDNGSMFSFLQTLKGGGGGEGGRTRETGGGAFPRRWARPQSTPHFIKNRRRGGQGGQHREPTGI